MTCLEFWEWVEVFCSSPTSWSVCLQNVWAVLDLYGPVRSVSIVSSTRLEEPEGTQPPSPSSDTGSEGDEDEEDEEHGLGVRGCSRALGHMDERLVGHWPPGYFWVLQACPGWIEAYAHKL